MAAVEKQLEAAQRFLRGVRSLPSYEDIQTKQLKGLLHCLDKVKDLSTAQAGIFLDALDASFSLSPDGLEEVIQAMRGTIPAEYSRGCASRGYGRGDAYWRVWQHCCRLGNGTLLRWICHHIRNFSVYVW